MKAKFWNKLIPVTAVIMIAGIALLIMMHAIHSNTVRRGAADAGAGHQLLLAAEDLGALQDVWLKALDPTVWLPSSTTPHQAADFSDRQSQVIQRVRRLASNHTIYQLYADTLTHAAAQLDTFSRTLATSRAQNDSTAARQYWNSLLQTGVLAISGKTIHQQQTAIHHRIRDVELALMHTRAKNESIRIYILWLLAATLFAFFYALLREVQINHALNRQYALNHGILQYLPDAAATTDNFYQLRQWNQAFTELFGTALNTKDTDIRDLLKPWVPSDTQALERAAAAGKSWQKQLNLLDTGGEQVLVEVCFVQLKGNNGKHAGALWICKDITRQQHQIMSLSRRAEHLELGLQRQINLLQQVWEKVPEGIFQTDLEGRYLHVNEFASRVLPLPVAHVLGKKLWEVFPGTIGSQLEAAFHTACNSGREQTFHFESPLSHQHYRVHLMPVGNTVTITLRDLSEVHRAKSSVHTLSAAMMQAREEERRRISKELHDELGQQLTGNKVMFDFLTNMLELPEGPLKQQFSKLDQQLSDAINKVRQLHRHFSHTQIEDLGLFEVMRHEAEIFARTQGITLTLHNEVEELLLPIQQAVGLYQVFTEALTNIQQHAGATRIDVLITLEENKVLMQIKDDGVGFATAKNKLGLGIGAMQERMLRLKGSLGIESIPGGGTTLLAQVPL